MLGRKSKAPNFCIVEQHLGRGGQPRTDEEWEYIRSQLGSFLAVVQLNPEDGEDVVPREIKHSVHTFKFPSPDFSGPVARAGKVKVPEPSQSMLREIQSVIAGNLAEGSGVYVHCGWGSDRTSLVIACRRMETGESPKRAKEEAEKMGMYGKELFDALEKYKPTGGRILKDSTKK